MKLHYEGFYERDSNWYDSDAPFFGNQLSYSLDMLDRMRQKLPVHKTKIICDVPLDFRTDDAGWRNAEDNGLTILRFWGHYRAASAHKAEYRPVSSYKHANESLSLLPPLQRGELPRKDEVLARLYIYFGLVEMGEEERAFSECRIILAAIRLLHHNGKLDMYDSKDILMSKTDVLPHQFIRLSTKLKMREEGASRPYYSRDERLDLMKELGIGLYLDARYNCATCGKTKSSAKGDGGVKQLSLCSRCSDIWYCGAECAKIGWKEGGHKEVCGSLPVEQPMKVTDMTIGILYTELTMGVTIIENSGCDELLVLAKDESANGQIDSKITSGIYDVLTDKKVEIEVDKKGANISDHRFMCGINPLDNARMRSSELSLDEKMTIQMKDMDTKSGKCMKEMHDIREKAGDWLFGLSRVPYKKKWPDDF